MIYIHFRDEVHSFNVDIDLFMEAMIAFLLLILSKFKIVYEINLSIFILTTYKYTTITRIIPMCMILRVNIITFI